MTNTNIWCLWNDKHQYNEILKNLDDIWSSSPTDDIISSEAERRIYESIFGPLDLQSKQELNWQKQKHGRITKNALKRVDNWLNHSKLKKWVEKIDDLYRKHKLSFYALMDEDAHFVRKAIKVNLGYEFGYNIYQESSNLIHGSTIDQLLIYGETFVAPKFTDFIEESKSTAKFICETCKGLVLALHLIQKQL